MGYLMSSAARGRRLLLAVTSGVLAVASFASGAPLPAYAASPITVTNTASPSPVASGTELTYTIVVSNTGGAKMTSLSLTDQVNGMAGLGVPPALVLTSSQGSCSQSNYLVTCAGGTLPGGASWTVSIRGVVTAAGGTTLNNTATAAGTKSATTFTGSATASVLVSGTTTGPLADLTITKSGPASVGTSSPMTYTLTVNNTGTANASDIQVVDTVPAGVVLSAASATGTNLFACSVSGQTVTCNGGAINAGMNGTVTINGTSPAVAGNITNTAVVDPNGTVPESNYLNNTSQAVTTSVVAAPPPPPIAITVSDNPDPVVPGALLTYKVVVTNQSGSRADYVVVTDGTQGLAAASLTVSATVTSGNAPSCSINAPQVSCTTNHWYSGGTIVLTITGTVVAGTGSTLIDTASVNANISNKGVSNSASETTTVMPAVDLTITKAGAPNPVCARSWPPVNPLYECTGGLTYTFVVGNSGVLTASPVLVRDPLPTGVVFDSSTAPAFSGGCAVDAANVLTCTGGVIGPQSSTTIKIVTVAPPTVGTITNTVTVNPYNSIPESDNSNNTATATTQVVSGIDLTVHKYDSGPNDPAGFDPIATSGTETYVITVDDLGPQDASNIRVRDTLPAGTTFRTVSADHGFTCSYSAGVVECVGGSLKGTASEFYPPFGLPGTDEAKITITIFAQPIVGTMHNIVRVNPLNEIVEIDSPTQANDIATQDTTVVNGGKPLGAFNDLTISVVQSSPPGNVAPNGSLTYTITVGNDGTDPANGVLVRNFLPAGSTFVSATGTDMFHCVNNGPTPAGIEIDCDGGSIPASGVAGNPATIAIQAFAPAIPGTYTDQAIADPNNTIPEGNETNNTSSWNTTVAIGGGNTYIDLKMDPIVTTISNPWSGLPEGWVTPGGMFSYSLTVENLGTNPAFNVELRDSVPPGTTFVSAADSSTMGGFTCGFANGVVDCTGATIDGSLDLVPGIGNTRTVTITLLAPKQNGVVLTDTATVNPTNAIPEADPTNNSASTTTAVKSNVDLSVVKTGPTSASQSQTATYDITVTNNGEDPVLGVFMHDPLPVGVIPLAAYVDDPGNNNFACQVSENPINVADCTGDLNGSTPFAGILAAVKVVIHVQVFITATDGTTFTNQACVDPNNTIVEYNELNNCSSASTHVGHPDIAITKTAQSTTVSQGDTEIYKITVSNQGDAKSTVAVKVTDTLDTKLTFVSAIATNSFTCSFTAPTVECDGGLLNPGENSVITLTVTINSSSGPISNEADVASVDPAELVTNNNKSTVSINVNGTSIDLVMTNQGDNPDPVPQGDKVTYTFLVTNAGSSTATGVVITDTFSDLTGMTFVSATASQGFTCALSTPTVTCTGNLAAGDSTTVKIAFQTTSTAPATETSTMTVNPAKTITESDYTNNTATEVTTITPALCTGCIDLVQDEIVAPATVAAGANVTFTTTVGNIGDQGTVPTNQVFVVWYFFGDLGSPTYSASNGFSCVTDASSGPGFLQVDCTGDLAAGQGTILTVNATATGASGDLIDAFAYADPNNTIAEFNESNNGYAVWEVTLT
jgi:uncharacterized repeat protein (TIGR01451 family)